MLKTPFYDPAKSYQENYDKGPFGSFAEVLWGKPGSGRAKKPSYVRSQDPDPETFGEFLGQKVKQPFGIPAGPVLNANYCRAAFLKGFDLCVYKTVRTVEQASHPVPNIVPLKVDGDLTTEKVAAGPVIEASEYREPLTITNSFGVPSMPVEVWQEDMREAVLAAAAGQVLIGSFQGTKRPGGTPESFIADFAAAARLVKETGAPILEANLSCPNEGTANLVCFDTATAVAAATAMKEAIGDTPLVIKLAYFENDSQLKDLIEKVGPIIDGIATVNTFPAKIVDSAGNQALPGEGRLVSGTCGAGIKWAGLSMVRRLVQLREELNQKFAIIGVGGVMNPADYFEYRALGADAVMSATGAMWNPELAEEIYGK
jgi:dihydroorotate dehydrogenase (NAD+) catalytic subunit